MLSFFKSKLPLGLDIGASNLKVVELAPTSSLPKLEQFLIRRREDNNLKNQLVQIKKEFNFSTDKMVIGIGGPSLIIRRINLPNMSEDELAEAISWQVDDYLPLPIDKTVFDYQVINREDGELELILVAAPKEVIQERIKAVEQAGFKVHSIAANPLVLRRILPTAKLVEQKSLVLINLGAKTTELIALEEGKFHFRRSFNFGGTDFTSEIREKKELSFREAESYKFKLKDKALISNSLSKLISDVKRSLKYRGILTTTEQLLVTGGGANLKILVNLLAKELDLNIGSFNSLGQIQFSPQEFSPHLLHKKLPKLSVSLGLALREVQTDDKFIARRA
ncbi:type IV pilus assembly protein PilM [Halobacteroides halobius DSM 5150]|uniref:Type IV pilus assembly protein PilM n=1 Tax=Halobacteroides halobius (strain ATCC 35273 / DSM 5150 / MD-1) TaxID=748449 RepID=L0K651_HALHC|nr:type IV pilus assembly protein PilM [Halobacteroides halobius]AGB40496.1 type IV pilus assembly protein PilM [Halobacteroides halobius DSM 5150]